jgi:hypothetical protein
VIPASRTQPRKKKFRAGRWAVAIVVLMIFVVGGLYTWAYMSTRETETCTVTDKTATTKVKSDGNGNNTSSTDYRVYTSDCGVLTIHDSWLLLRFNSADIYGQLQEKKTYTLDVVGWRNGFLSQFPNILGAEEKK